MKKVQREDSARTRGRLIAAASEVFAKKDYTTATIAEICSLAGANLAAVNYHFGDKETLYREAWRHAFREGVKAYPIDRGVGVGAPAGERLKGLIRSFVLRSVDENDKEFLIVHREMSNPTGLLEEVIETELLPMQERMEAIVKELLGPAASNEHVRYCALSVMNQCLHPMLKRSAGIDAERSRRPRLDIPAFIDHVVLFSLGGIGAIAEAAEGLRNKVTQDEKERSGIGSPPSVRIRKEERQRSRKEKR
jgi:TetR/AcrR family transcriptional regulator, regulator of cefoperazone and chloramphenicol sensitivity